MVSRECVASFGRKIHSKIANKHQTCKWELQRKMARSRFPWRWMMFLLVSVVLGIVAYDLYSSKTLQDSKTIRFLENYGILAVLSQGWAKISLYFGVAYSWLQVNVPHYCSVVYREVSPYVIKMLDFMSHIEEYTRPYRHMAVRMLLELQDKIYSLAPDFWSKVGNYVWLSWDFLKDYSTWMWAHMATFVADTYHWIEHRLVSAFLFGAVSPQSKLIIPSTIEHWRVGTKKKIISVKLHNHRKNKSLNFRASQMQDVGRRRPRITLNPAKKHAQRVNAQMAGGDFNTENIQKTLTWSVSWLQNTTYTAFEWCSQLWTPVKSH